MKRIILSFICFTLVHFGYTQSSMLDPTWGNGGIVTANLGRPFSYDGAYVASQSITAPDSSIYIFLNQYILKRHYNGTIDSTYGFNRNGISQVFPFEFLHGALHGALQPDGKIVVIGYDFNSARFTQSGVLDSSYGINGIEKPEFDIGTYQSASQLFIGSDGKIVVAGVLEGDLFYFLTARYNTDGTPDSTFGTNGVVVTDFGYGTNTQINPVQSRATSVLVLADNKIIVAGYVNTYSARGHDFALVKYNTDGSYDSTFGTNGKQVSDFGDGDDTAYSITYTAADKIVVAGITSIGQRFVVARYNSNGTADSTFNGTGHQFLAGNINGTNPQMLAIQSTGKITVVGYGYAQNGAKMDDYVMARLNDDGSIDNTFGSGGILFTDINSSEDVAKSISVDKNDKLLVVGDTGTNFPTLAVVRYLPDGQIDNTFGRNGILVKDTTQGNTQFYTTRIQKDGKVVAAGLSWNGSKFEPIIARFNNNNGSLDSTFGSNGSQLLNIDSGEYAIAMELQQDGKIVLGIVTYYGNGKVIITRLNSNGSPDYTFGDSSIASLNFYNYSTLAGDRTLAIQTDGKIVVAAYTSGDNPTVIERFTNAGILDTSFNHTGILLSDVWVPQSLVIQADNKLVVGGSNNSDYNYSIISRYNTDGSPDKSFGTPYGSNQYIFSGNYLSHLNTMALQPDGKIVAGGYIEDISGSNSRIFIARFKENGEYDSTFAVNGLGTVDVGGEFQFQRSLVITNDGNIAEGGEDGQGNFVVILYNPDGSPNQNFGNNGVVHTTIALEGAGDGDLRSLALDGNELYAAGASQYFGDQGVIVKYFLTSGGALPVSLSDFTGTLQNNKVLLQWHTAGEQNLSYFNVERSGDGNNFTQIASVAAASNSSAKLFYSDIDPQPLQGMNYYRLQMVDVDGKNSYSKIVSVNVTNNLFSIEIYPNPVGNTLYLQTTGNGEKAIIEITDNTGKLLRMMQMTISNGIESIDISTLPKGVYFLTGKTASASLVQKFVKE